MLYFIRVDTFNRQYRNIVIFKMEPEVNELLLRIGEFGDQKAFETLYHHYYSWLFVIISKVSKNRQIVEEILEDVFIKIWDMRGEYNRIANFETFIFVMARNKSIDYLRKKKSSLTLLLLDESHYNSADHYYSQNELKLRELLQCLDKAIENLPPKCQNVFRLVREEEYSHKKTADLGVSPRTIEVHIRNAIKKIEEQLKVAYMIPQGVISNEPILWQSCFSLKP